MWHGGYTNDNFDDASYDHDDVPEDELVAMMINSHDFSLDGDHLDVLPQQ